MSQALTADTFAKITDSDICQAVVGSPVTSDVNYLVLTHEAISLTAIPTILVDGLPVATDVIGSGADYELKRVSSTQTVIKIKTPVSATYAIESLGADPAIGAFTIGVDFVVQ